MQLRVLAKIIGKANQEVYEIVYSIEKARDNILMLY